MEETEKQFKLRVYHSINSKIENLKEYLIDALDLYLTSKSPDYIVNKSAKTLIEEAIQNPIIDDLTKQIAELIVENEKLK